MYYGIVFITQYIIEGEASPVCFIMESKMWLKFVSRILVLRVRLYINDPKGEPTALLL